ncbi:hypothetical protein WDW86_21375 [Bdellovibrionota bacterium FG-2]
MKPLALWIPCLCLVLTGLSLAADSVYRSPEELKQMDAEDLGYFALDLRDIHIPALRKVHTDLASQLKDFEAAKGCKNEAKKFTCAAAYEAWNKDPKAAITFPTRLERHAYKAYKDFRDKLKKAEDQVHKLQLVLLETGVQLAIKTTPQIYVAKKPAPPLERQPASPPKK